MGKLSEYLFAMRKVSLARTNFPHKAPHELHELHELAALILSPYPYRERGELVQ